MKVLYFVHHLFGKDGWSVNALNTIEPMVSMGRQCVAIVNEVNPAIPVVQIAILRKPLRYLRYPFLIFLDLFKILKIIKKEKPDVIHFLVEPYAFFSYFIKLFFNCKQVLTVCGTYAVLPYNQLRTKLLSILYYRSIDFIISISGYTASRLLKILPKLKDKVIVIPAGINWADLKSAAAATKQTPQTAISIVFTGQIKERKGVLEALQALSLYKNTYHSNFIFSIIGQYDRHQKYWQELNAYITANGLTNNVEFCGLLPESQKNEKLKNADLFIMLSRVDGDHFEGYGLVYLEANAFGVPVIGPNDSGTTQPIKDGYSGYVVTPSDPRQVVEKIDLILNKHSINAQNCLLWAEAHDRRKISQQIFALY
ncbi:MAG: glycosyltransferase family 4 protein [Candidatus Magasanikbacteria bacterium]|nr:glycosyltransferase family 4 protein [Candidatus Magasanikbacteria bacterium]